MFFITRYACFLFFIALTAAAANNARADECECPGKDLAKFNGGYTVKMTWYFSASMVQAARPNSPALICYKKSVLNKSNDTILNIRWDVAAFRRRLIPSRYTNDSCVTLPGLLSASPISGPLYYGISSDAYETTVQPPLDGWVAKETQSHAQIDEFPPLRSVFEFDVDRGQEGTVTIYSYVKEEGPKRRLIYEVEYGGNPAVNFLLNLPANAETENLPFLRPMLLKPRQLFSAYVEGPVTAQRAVVLISDIKDSKRGLAVETVGVYAPANGKRLNSDKMLMDFVQ